MKLVRVGAVVLALVAGCRSAALEPVPERTSEVRAWGTMREVLREGRSEGRVALADAVGPHDVGVGALERLAGEVTVVDGRAWVSRADRDDAPGAEEPAAGDARAALLVLATVPAWDEHELGPCADYAELEERIAAVLRARGRDLAAPTPVRVRGLAQEIRLHVVAGACPIANPDGPEPWRWLGGGYEVELVGIFVDGGAGRWTHHGRRSHLHARTSRAMGHLDGVVFERATLLVPASGG